MGLFDKAKDAAAQAMGQAHAGITKARDDHAASKREEAAAAAAAPQPLLELVSHIDGKNAKVRLWPDRLEWERPRGVSGGKVTAGLLTAGTSLLVTGVKGGKDEHDTVLAKHITNVLSRKDGLVYYAVDVQTSAGAAVNKITFRVDCDEAAAFRSAVLDAMRAVEAGSVPTVVRAGCCARRYPSGGRRARRGLSAPAARWPPGRGHPHRRGVHRQEGRASGEAVSGSPKRRAGGWSPASVRRRWPAICSDCATGRETPAGGRVKIMVGKGCLTWN